MIPVTRLGSLEDRRVRGLIEPPAIEIEVVLFAAGQSLPKLAPSPVRPQRLFENRAVLGFGRATVQRRPILKPLNDLVFKATHDQCCQSRLLATADAIIR